ncbi:Reverse transcriptase domain-containing protein [Aphis craccivora]|uniref:Reverse transcriptase domain-containing protein n=1 Tax=Aphis craccivora TaxID=307492 RepID=A0A6G0YGH9_APHCR|nr:Reverse transcriptase domain-containing protein [Aphis craccivora]
MFLYVRNPVLVSHFFCDSRRSVLPSWPMPGVSQGGNLSSLLFSIFINGIHRNLRHCHFLCFINDLNCKVEYFGQFSLSLYFSKCKVMSFNRIRSPISLSYRLDESVIIRVADDGVMYLEFKFNHKLDSIMVLVLTIFTIRLYASGTKVFKMWSCNFKTSRLQYTLGVKYLNMVRLYDICIQLVTHCSLKGYSIDF